MKRWKRLILLLFFIAPQMISAQSRYAEALDRYERICEQCLRLRREAAAGVDVPTESLNALFQELSTLRQDLRNAEGEMTMAERERFLALRRYYAPYFSAERPREALLSPLSPLPTPTIPLPQRLSLPARNQILATPRPKPWLLGAAVIIGLPEKSPGALLMLQKGDFGAYLKGDFPLAGPSTTGICFSDGTSESGGLIWTSGRSETNRTMVSAGAVWQPLSFAAFYAGAGWGASNLFWESADGEWMKVTDKSMHGLAAETGLMIPIGPVLILAGISTISFRTLCAEFGLGMRIPCSRQHR